MDLQAALYVFLIVASICFSSLCVYAILVLQDIRRAVRKVDIVIKTVEVATAALSSPVFSALNMLRGMISGRSKKLS